MIKCEKYSSREFRFGLGITPKHLSIYSVDGNGNKIVVNSKEEAMAIIAALANYFFIDLNEFERWEDGWNKTRSK